MKKHLSALITLHLFVGASLMVRQVAIVGFTLEQEQANGVQITFNGSDRGIKTTRDKVVSPLRISPLKEAERQRKLEYDPTADQIFEELRDLFAKTYSWKTKSLEEMKASEVYQDFRSKPAMFSAFVPSTVPVHRFGANGLGPALDSQSFTLEDREKLAAELGVDGFAFIKVRVALNRVNNIEIGRLSVGSYRPSAITTIEFYNLKDKDPIWIDRLASGKKSEGSVVQISGVTDYSQLRPQVVDAARKSFLILLNRSRRDSER